MYSFVQKIKELSFRKKILIVLIIAIVVIGALLQFEVIPSPMGASMPSGDMVTTTESELVKTWSNVDQSTFMCTEGNLNDEYNENDHGEIDTWKKDDRPYYGWRWCGVTVDQCKSACIAAGDCSGIHYTPNRCCFPLRSSCVDKTTNTVGGVTDESVPEAGRYVLS